MRIYLVIGREDYEADVTIKAFCEERDAESLAERLREIQSREPTDPDEYEDDSLWQADFDKWANDMRDAGCPFITGWEQIVVEPLEVVEPEQPAEQERTCRWSEIDPEVYSTQCGWWKSRKGYPIPSPSIAGLEECPHCGGKIVEDDQ